MTGINPPAFGPSSSLERADRLWRSLRQQRLPVESQWQEVISQIAPSRGAGFGRNLAARQYDTTALLAAENLAAALYGLTANPANDWFRFEAPMTTTTADQRAWLDASARQVASLLRRSACGFYPAVLEAFRDVVLFGTAVVGLEWQGDAPQCQRQPLSDCWLVGEGARPSGLVRRLSLSAADCQARWPDGASATALRPWDDERRFTVLHLCLTPEEALRQGLIEQLAEAAGRVLSLHVNLEDRRVLSRNWFQEMPFAVLRWSTLPQSPYGLSPAMAALPDVMLCNSLTRASVTASQMAVDPPLLTVNENGLRGMKTHPGAIIYGGLDPSGRRLYEPLTTGSNDASAPLALLAQKQDQVREAFFYSLLLLASGGNLTATEFLGRYEEKVRLFAPYLARIQAELLEPLLLRCLRLALRAGVLPAPEGRLRALLLPASAADARTAQLTVGIRSPLAQTQRLTEANSLLRAVQAVAGLSAQWPELSSQLDGNRLARALLTALDLPLSAPGGDLQDAPTEEANSA